MNLMPNDALLLVLQHRYAGKAWCYNGDGYQGLRWTDDEPKPSEAHLFAQVEDVMTEIAEQKQAQADAAQAKQEATASARTKLAALGLTDEEVSALLGG